jgi:hypothetical protein
MSSIFKKASDARFFCRCRQLLDESGWREQGLSSGFLSAIMTPAVA